MMTARSPQFLRRLSARQPLLLVLDDLQWADSASLELLHFVGRRIGSERIGILCAYNEADLEHNPALRAAEQARPDRLARIERRMGLACYWSGRYERALAHLGAGTDDTFTATSVGAYSVSGNVVALVDALDNSRMRRL